VTGFIQDLDKELAAYVGCGYGGSSVDLNKDDDGTQSTIVIKPELT
jgi:hypothetical protein